MRTGIRDDIWADHKAIEEDDFGSPTITINGVDYNCLITRVDRGNQPMEGGLWPTYSATVSLRTEQFVLRAEDGTPLLAEDGSYLYGTFPFEGQLVTFNSELLQIQSVESRTNHPVMTIQLTNPDGPE